MGVSPDTDLFVPQRLRLSASTHDTGAQEVHPPQSPGSMLNSTQDSATPEFA